MPIVAAEDGALRLPDIILWAFHLNEGDLLAVSREETETCRCRFRSYGEAVWIIADGISDAWHCIEPMLRLPMAALGPHGALLLPEEAAALAPRPGDALLLVVEPALGEGFTLEPAGRHRMSSKLFLHADYVLPVEEGQKMRLPEGVLWVLGLREGDQYACKTRLGTVDFEPFVKSEPLKNRSVVELEPGGAFALPESFLRDLRPDWQVRLTVTLNPDPALRLTYYVA